MKCELKNREQLIDDYVAGNLSAEEEAFFDEHCFNCDLCFQELRLREECINLIKQEGTILFADYLEKQRAKQIGIIQALKNRFSQLYWALNKRWIYATALVSAAAILSFFVYRNLSIRQEISITDQYPIDSTVIVERKNDTSQIIRPETPTTESVQKLITETQQKAKQKLDSSQVYAANFTTLPYLEEMVADVTRSSAVRVLSPKISEKMSDQILFQWEISDGTVDKLKILDNGGAEILAIKLEHNRFMLTEKLNPGLYYWKLENADELFYVGKFLVE